MIEIFAVIMTLGTAPEVKHVIPVSSGETCRALLGELMTRMKDTDGKRFFYGCIKVEDGKVYHPPINGERPLPTPGR